MVSASSLAELGSSRAYRAVWSIRGKRYGHSLLGFFKGLLSIKVIGNYLDTESNGIKADFSPKEGSSWFCLPFSSDHYLNCMKLLYLFRCQATENVSIWF